MPLTKDNLFRLCLCMFMQLWSWSVWASVQVEVLEGKTYAELSRRHFPRWIAHRSNIADKRVVICVFVVLGVHLNLFFSHPRNVYYLIGLPYLGVCINVSVFLLVLREACRKGSYRFSGPPSLWPMLRYTMRGSPVNRIFVVVTAFVMSFVIWLAPWCCVMQ